MAQDRGVDTADLIPVAEHQRAVADLLATTTAETRPLDQCLGLALAADLTSPIALPAFDNSAMDGYAVRSVDLAEADEQTVVLPVAEDVPAGRVDNPPLRPGTAHRIMTGAQVPPGADAVIPVERTDGGTAEVRAHAAVKPGANVRKAGEDVTPGTAVLRAGAELGAAQLGLAAAVGTAELPVHRPPRVLVLSTGSELVEPGTPLRPGQIYESNGLMLASAVREAGGRARLLRFVADDVEQFHAALEPEIAATELILTSGGVSAGAYEVVKDALAGQGVEFTKIAVQPGMPQGAGRYRGGPAVVALPGNPVSAMVSFEVFVRPALRRSAGFANAQRPVRAATLTEPVRAAPRKRVFRRARFDPRTGEVTPHGGPGSHLLAAMAGANCLLEIPEDVEELPAGASAQIWDLG
jgi:molybdopterin molybdotransferase